MLPDSEDDLHSTQGAPDEAPNEAPDEAPLLPDGSEESTPAPSAGSGTRSCGSATLAGCIFLEALTLLVLVAFCATLVGVSFLMQATRTSPDTATPAVAEMITPEPAPTETETPTPPVPTVAPATPTLAAPTPAVSATPTLTPMPAVTPRRFTVFLPLVVRPSAP